MKDWRLLDTGSLTAAENMALDDVILEFRSRGRSPNTFRFLQFNPPAALVGYHQVLEHEIRLDYCRRNGIDFNRRLTGGGAIYFDSSSIGWEIYASKSEFNGLKLDERFFGHMCQGTIRALASLGINAEYRPKNDIEVRGRKISGTGGTERGGSFLFQGTLLVDFNADTMLRALRIPTMKLKDKEIESVKQRVTCIRWELETSPSQEEIKKALALGFEEALGIRFVEDRLTGQEETLLSKRLDSFRSEDWIVMDRVPLNESLEVSAIDKLPGGLIRVSLLVDRSRNIITDVLITGDFFVFPSNAITELEKYLRYTPCDANSIESRIREFFNLRLSHIIGIRPEDLAELVIQAVEKTSFEALGIGLQEANHIYFVNERMEDIFRLNHSTLLLPYCSKLPTCKYRKVDGCEVCGCCTIGTAYELAERFGLMPITIQNFEHLMSVLADLQARGEEAYIGCCCEGFYSKHLDDLRETGMPGMLMDINDKTCYDLGKEIEALKGEFDSLTTLKTDLLEKLLSCIHVQRLMNHHA